MLCNKVMLAVITVPINSKMILLQGMFLSHVDRLLLFLVNLKLELLEQLKAGSCSSISK